MTAFSTCPGCGVRLPDDPEAPHHRYMTSSSGCWQAFGELLAREFSDSDRFALHRLTVDTYAAQHPGQDAREQRQSAAVHLVALCHALEHDLDARTLNRATQHLASEHREWPRLDPPERYAMTVVDLGSAATAAEHLALVRRRAEATWQAWGLHHRLIRRWAAEALAPARRA